MSDTPKFDPERQPYGPICGELVADALALHAIVMARRPETTAIEGHLHVVFSVASRTVLVGLERDGEVVLIERIHVDPDLPNAFGMSDLPVQVIKNDPTKH